MATIIDAKYSTVIGTPDELRAFLSIASGAGIMDLKYSNFIVLREPMTDARLRAALEAVPAPKGRRKKA